jgi:steroid 5-alpha reductase family enzyme
VIAGALTGLLAMVVALTLVWVLSVRLRDASIVDICWGPGFVLLAWLYAALFDAFTPRPVLVGVLVTLWGVRLAVHIFRRHRGEDPRYAAMRAARGPAFWWRSLLVVFWLQAVILWFVALPLLVTAAAPGPPAVTITDVLGVVLFATGFAFEAIGDAQLARFRSDVSNRGTVLDTGLWRYTRHPNYFGDALLWWGVYLIALSAPGGWITIASPLVMTLLLLRVSGVTLLERGLSASKPGYAEYVARTSAFVPWMPRPR